MTLLTNWVLILASGLRLWPLTSRSLYHVMFPPTDSVWALNCWPMGSAMIEFCMVMLVVGLSVVPTASMLFHEANSTDTWSKIMFVAWWMLMPLSVLGAVSPGRNRT